MSDHAAHEASHGHTDHSHAEHGHAPAAGELRFEKEELADFVEADRGAGQFLGKLLGALFCLLLTLMTGASIWTSRNNSSNVNDPQAYAYEKPAAKHH